MSAEIWIVLITLASVIAAAGGYFYARRGQPSQADLDALQQELDRAEQKAAKVETGVTEHFEQSAVLFGRLAHDYRAFLEHFSKSAQELGISESMAHELLQRADQPLLGHDADVIDTQQKAQEQAEIAEATLDSAESDSAEPETAEPETAELETAEIEPPLIEDVVEEPLSPALQREDESELVTSTVVDVDLEPLDSAAEQTPEQISQKPEQNSQKPARSSGQAGS